MADLNINIYALLGFIEILLILMMLGAVLFIQLRSARRDAASLREQMRRAGTEAHREPVAAAKPAETAEPQRDYADFLREELTRSSLLLGEDPGARLGDASDMAPGNADVLARQMLAARHQFLQLELDVQGVASTADVEAQRQSVIAGMQSLLDSLRPQDAPETKEQPIAEPEAAPEAPRALSEVNRLQDQISHLRTVIDNQHDVMRELRHLLEEHGGESEELHEALRKLGDAEAQAVELQRCLEVMEHENERLKQTRPEADDGPGASPDADMLRDLVGSQQRTISKLQHMLQSLAPDSGKAKELGDAIGKIQRANSELNSCVMVLEDENAMLRGQVESLQERIADLESLAPVEQPPESGTEAESEDDLNALWGSALAQQASGEAEVDAATQRQAETTADEQPPTAERPMETEDLLAELFGTAGYETDDKRTD